MVEFLEYMPTGKVRGAPKDFFRVEQIDIANAEVHDGTILVRARWEDYPYLLAYAFDPWSLIDEDERTSSEDFDFQMWKNMLSRFLVDAFSMSPVRSRRLNLGDAIEITAAAEVESRYSARFLTVSDSPESWAEVRRYSNPVVPPVSVDQWRTDGSLIAWHFATLDYDVALPIFAQIASRWGGDGVAILEILDFDMGLPDPFLLLAIMDAAHRAASKGAHTIQLSAAVEGIALLGFRQQADTWQLDSRMMDVDYSSLAAKAANASGWSPSGRIESALATARGRRYTSG